MANKNHSLSVLIAVVLVVAVITSILTANITGNVIKVKKEKKGTEIYTKVEIDDKFKNIVDNQKQAVLDVFGTCEIKVGDIGHNFENCNDVCNYYNETCVFGRVDFQNRVRKDETFEQDWVQSILTCNSDYSKYLHPEMEIGCVCCPPINEMFYDLRDKTVPFYRLYNPISGDHLYTTNDVEKDILIKQYGYTLENIAGYIFNESMSKIPNQTKKSNSTDNTSRNSS